MNQDPLNNTCNYYLYYYQQAFKEYHEHNKYVKKLEKKILKLVLEKNYTLIDKLDYYNIKKRNNDLLKNLCGFTKIYFSIKDLIGFDLIEN